MSKYTPGPWYVEPTGESSMHGPTCTIDASPMKIVARPDYHGTQEEYDANARLIAEAPDLAQRLHEAIQYLEQIRIVAERLGQNVGLEDIIDDCKATFTKATGEQP